MRIKAPFVIQTSESGANNWGFVDAGYTVRQLLTLEVPSTWRRRFVTWWVWGYVQSEKRILSEKELEL